MPEFDYDVPAPKRDAEFARPPRQPPRARASAPGRLRRAGEGAPHGGQAAAPAPCLRGASGQGRAAALPAPASGRLRRDRWPAPGRSSSGWTTAEGVLELRRRGEAEFLITVGGRVLMNSVNHRSEAALGELACRSLGGRRAPRVLVGGLGMGFTLRAVLDALPVRPG